MASDALLTLDGLETCASGGDRGLRGVSLVVGRGAAVAISGLNGDGKDALCRCLAGEVQRTAGTVTFDGAPLGTSRHLAARRGLIVALVNNRVFDEMSVKDNLTCSFAWHRGLTTSDRLDSVLATFPDLKTRLGQRAGTLSGGEQQMVALGRALLAAPKLIVLEEPWLGLAPTLIDFFLDRIADIRRTEQVSVLWTEDSSDRALQRSDAAYDMSGGRLIPLR